MSAHPVYRSILVVDVEGSSGRTDAEKPQLREALYGALTVAFARAGLLWDTCRREDRGDGAYILVPAGVPKSTLAGDLVAALDGVLAEPRVGGGSWPRLRLSLHAGEVTFDVEGSSGRDVDLAFALADAQPVRDALDAARTARCVLVVSDPFHAALAQGGPGLSWVDDFDPVSIPTKLGFRPAWIRSPGAAAPNHSAPTTGGAAPWWVLVGLPDGPVCGPGLLIADRHVLTCAHLVPGGRTTPRGVAVTFGGTLPGASGTGFARRVEVVAWTDPAPSNDPTGISSVDTSPGFGIAVLRVPSDLPFEAAPAPLARLGHPAPGRRLLASGPRLGAVEIVGSAPTAGGLVRLRYLADRNNGAVAGPWGHCSPGTPILDGTTGAVVGVLVERTGWPVPDGAVMISMEAAARHWPPLEHMLGPGLSGAPDPGGYAPTTGPSGYAGAPASGASPAVSVLEFALAIADLDSLGTGADRDHVIGMLGLTHPDISGTVRRHTDRRFDVTSLVRTCRQYPNGLDDLLAILQQIEGGSVQMRKVMALRTRLTP